MWLWLLTFTITLTGVTLAFSNAGRDLVQPFSPISERLHEAMPETDEEIAIGLGAAVARVTANMGQAHSVRFFPAIRQYAVRTYDDRDPDSQGRLWTYVSMVDGAVPDNAMI